MLTTVMSSCAQREAARALTIPQLREVGLDPMVFLSPCSPAGPEQNRANALAALSWAQRQGGPVLFVEDDIDLAPDFAWHVRVAAELDALTYLYLNDTPGRLRAHHGQAVADAILAGHPLPRGAYAVQRRAALFGTQAVVLPEWLVPDLVERLGATNAKEPFDGELFLWARAHKHKPVYVMLPHPVQHRQDRTGREPTDRVMRSASFPLARVPAGDPVVVSHNSAAADLEAWREARAFAMAARMERFANRKRRPGL